MDNLVVLNNEKVSKENNEFYSRNYNFKILPEGLNKYFKVEYIVRKSKTKEHHKLNLQNVKIASNIIQFIYFVISTFKNKNTKYYVCHKYQLVIVCLKYIQEILYFYYFQ